MNILICEDDISIQDLIEEILQEDMHYQLCKCSNIKDFFDILSKTKIDLVILDYWLNKTKADNIIIQLKKEYPDIPVILMSAIVNLKDVADKFGVDDYIKKPFDLDEFKFKVNNNLYGTDLSYN